MLQHDLQEITLKQLRAYVLAHQGDNEAFCYYMDWLRDDPTVAHHSGSPDELPKLEQLIQQRDSSYSGEWMRRSQLRGER